MLHGESRRRDGPRKAPSWSHCGAEATAKRKLDRIILAGSASPHSGSARVSHKFNVAPPQEVPAVLGAGDVHGSLPVTGPSVELLIGKDRAQIDGKTQRGYAHLPARRIAAPTGARPVVLHLDCDVSAREFARAAVRAHPGTRAVRIPAAVAAAQ